MQLSAGDNTAHLVQFDGKDWSAPRLKALLADPAVLKIFHFARFDMAVLAQHLGVMTGPVYCTKIASKLARTYTDRHGLKDLCAELLGVDLSKQQQSSDWGADKLTDQQKHYAASDVLYLHALKAKLDAMLAARGPDGGGRGLLPLPADARQPRPRRLRGRGHLRALSSRERLRGCRWCQRGRTGRQRLLSRLQTASRYNLTLRNGNTLASARVRNASLLSRRASAASRPIPRMPRPARPSACSAAPSIRRMPPTA